jgi:pimeloyl-ACP methyl ester carboxylesterase/DNA-binding CsgD family transcriptional regulator
VDPRTRYAAVGDVRIAYQVTGGGALDLVMVPGLTTHLEAQWQWPVYRRFMTALSRRCRLVRFDKRGTGLSDPVTEPPDLDQRLADLVAVMDAAGVRRGVLLGYSEGGPIAVTAAVRRPERVRGLVLYGTSPRRPPPWAMAQLREMVEHWGEGLSEDLFAPSEGAAGRERLATLERMAASPGMARALVEALSRIDVTGMLSSISVPTLVVHRTGDVIPVRDARYAAGRIPGARLVELPGADHMPWLGQWSAVVQVIAGFLDELAGHPTSATPQGRAKPGWRGLTPAELSVTRLVAEGRSNPEVAAQLFVSRKTVETHLKRIFLKAGVESRAQLAAEFTRETAAIT